MSNVKREAEVLISERVFNLQRTLFVSFTTKYESSQFKAHDYIFYNVKNLNTHILICSYLKTKVLDIFIVLVFEYEYLNPQYYKIYKHIFYIESSLIFVLKTEFISKH